MKNCEYCGGEIDCSFVENFRFRHHMCDDGKLIPVEIFIPNAEVYTCKECGTIVSFRFINRYTDAGDSDRGVIFAVEMELDE